MGLDAIEHKIEVSASGAAAPIESGACAGDAPDAPLASNLAALLDRFTASVTHPDDHTLGELADAVGALRGEFAMLANHFQSNSLAAGEDAALERLLGGDSPVEPEGLADEEALQHVCWQITT